MVLLKDHKSEGKFLGSLNTPPPPVSLYQIAGKMIWTAEPRVKQTYQSWMFIGFNGLQFHPGWISQGWYDNFRMFQF